MAFNCFVNSIKITKKKKQSTRLTLNGEPYLSSTKHSLIAMHAAKNNGRERESESESVCIQVASFMLNNVTEKLNFGQ